MCSFVVACCCLGVMWVVQVACLYFVEVLELRVLVSFECVEGYVLEEFMGDVLVVDEVCQVLRLPAFGVECVERACEGEFGVYWIVLGGIYYVDVYFVVLYVLMMV